MAKPEWGIKRICQSCAAKFYDLGRSPIACPQCGARFDPEALLKSRRSRPAAPAKPAKPVTKAAARATAEPLLQDVGKDEANLTEPAGDEAKDAAIEDPSELGGNDELTDVVVAGEDKDS
ncbi:MAG: TIGR02300 family protein [Kiloniellales bacterium]